jgi:probable phosphomutase (TIGR03848 family)
MTTLVLLRHGRSTANVSGVLAGRSEGVELDDKGREQAAAVVPRLASVTFDRLVSSPLTRCRQTIAPLAAATGVAVEYDEAFAEVDYGDWTGGKLAELAKEPLWRTVQGQPSAVVFPGGEGLAQVSARATAAVRGLVAAAGKDDVLLVCSHGDVIKAILADALGLHLDGFQRIVVAPASISVIRYTPGRPFVERVNDAGELGTLRPPPEQPKEQEAPAGDAVVGGGA